MSCIDNAVLWYGNITCEIKITCGAAIYHDIPSHTCQIHTCYWFIVPEFHLDATSGNT